MLQLNEAKQLSAASRSFSYELPDFLAKEGKCTLSIEAKSHADTSAVINNSMEPLIFGAKARKVHLDRKLESLEGKLNGHNLQGPAEAEYVQWAREETQATQWMNRSSIMACYDNCVTSWNTNIWDNASGGEIDPTRENFEALVGLAYPDSGISDVPDLIDMFEKIRADLFDMSGDEAQAVAEAQGQDEKN